MSVHIPIYDTIVAIIDRVLIGQAAMMARHQPSLLIGIDNVTSIHGRPDFELTGI